MHHLKDIYKTDVQRQISLTKIEDLSLSVRVEIQQKVMCTIVAIFMHEIMKYAISSTNNCFCFHHLAWCIVAGYRIVYVLS